MSKEAKLIAAAERLCNAYREYINANLTYNLLLEESSIGVTNYAITVGGSKVVKRGKKWIWTGK